MPSLADKLSIVIDKNSESLHAEITEILKKFNPATDEIGEINAPLSELLNSDAQGNTYTILQHVVARGYYMLAFKLIACGADPHIISSLDGYRGLIIDIGDLAFRLANSNLVSRFHAEEIMAFTLANIYLLRNDMQHRDINTIAVTLAAQRCTRLHDLVAKEADQHMESLSANYTLLERLAALLVKQYLVKDRQDKPANLSDICFDIHKLNIDLYSSKCAFDAGAVYYWRNVCFTIPQDKLKFAQF